MPPRLLAIAILLAACGCSPGPAPSSGADAGIASDDEAPDPDDADDDPSEPDDPDGWTWDDENDDVQAAGKRVRIDPGLANEAELVKALPVGRSSDGATRRIVMQLGPERLPGLVSGDRLITAAEVQVTSRCDVGQSAPGCNYNPKVRGQLILSGDPNDKSPSGAGSRALSGVETIKCTKAEHHCMIVFRPRDATHRLEDGFDLPCVGKGTCHVNLVMWAWHPDARSGGQDKVLVGENEGNYLANGEIQGDKGRLMAVRERGLTASDRRRSETSGGGDVRVPTNTNPTLIYSHRLKRGDIKAGEQFLVEAKLVTAVSSRARFSTKMFVTKDRGDVGGGRLEKISPGEIGEHNGINCTTGTSPCTTRKVAVFRATGDIKGPVYVNIIAKSAVPGGGSANVVVRRGSGWLRSTRYRAALGN